MHLIRTLLIFNPFESDLAGTDARDDGVARAFAPVDTDVVQHALLVDPLPGAGIQSHLVPHDVLLWEHLHALTAHQSFTQLDKRFVRLAGTAGTFEDATIGKLVHDAHVECTSLPHQFCQAERHG
jgi:hypothetical protein